MFTLLLVFITLLYPVAIWLGEGHVEPRVLAGLLTLAGLTRLATLKIPRSGRWWLAGMLLLVALTVWSNLLLPLKLYPVLVNVALFGAFAHSLVFPPSMVERFARLHEPNLPAKAIGYTRRVTQIWCGFFAVNGALALITALWATPTIWLLYNGLIAYILMGLLFTGEFCVRRYLKRGFYA